MRRPAPPQFVEAPTTRKPFYVARTAPLRPQTSWSLEGGQLVEVCGKTRKAWPLSGLKSLAVVGETDSRWRAAHLMFGRRRVLIPAQSILGNLTFEDRSSAFDAFMAALEAETATVAATAQPAGRAPRQAAQALIWGMILTGGGALLMIGAALAAGMTDLGLAFGARLLFAPILMAAALPWLTRSRS